jgi:hypothetical protein
VLAESGTGGDSLCCELAVADLADQVGGGGQDRLAGALASTGWVGCLRSSARRLSQPATSGGWCLTGAGRGFGRRVPRRRWCESPAAQSMPGRLLAFLGVIGSFDVLQQQLGSLQLVARGGKQR